MKNLALKGFAIVKTAIAATLFIFTIINIIKLI